MAIGNPRETIGLTDGSLQPSKLSRRVAAGRTGDETGFPAYAATQDYYVVMNKASLLSVRLIGMSVRLIGNPVLMFS